MLLRIFPLRRRGIVSVILCLCYGLYGPEFEYVQRYFHYFQKFQNGPGTHTVLLLNEYLIYFPGDKAAGT